MTDFPSGTIGYSTGYVGGYTHSMLSLQRTLSPPGTNIITTLGKGGKKNNVLSQMDGDWIWLVNDEYAWEPDTLVNLLHTSYDENIDIVVPLVLEATPPFSPIVYEKVNDQGNLDCIGLENFTLEVKEIYAAYVNGMLIRKKVLEGMTPPWFEPGKLNAKSVDEDINFCLKARRAGFNLYLDTKATLSSIHMYTVKAVFADEWMMELDIENHRMHLPLQQHDE